MNFPVNGQGSDPPAVTVLMTVYNGLPYLREAVESVLSQSFSDFELLVIEDAGTDDSASYLRSIRDPRLRLVFNSKNVGQAEALNQGLAIARGEYIARLDQDDVCLPNRLRRQLDFLKARPDLAGAGTWWICIGPEGQKIGLGPDNFDLPAGNFGTFAGLLWTQTTPVGHPTVMIRRRLLQEMGGYEQAFAPTEDFALWTRFGFFRHPLGVVPEPLVKARIHPRQQSVQKSGIQRAKGMQAHQRFIAAFCADGENPEEISLFLQMDEATWERFRSGLDVRRLLSALERTMARACRTWKLSSIEEDSFRRRVEWWLRRGALHGALNGRAQSLAVTGLVLPALILSPLLSPPVRRWISPWVAGAKRLRTQLARICYSDNQSPPGSPAAEGDSALNRLANAFREVRQVCPELPVLAIHWMHLKQPIHPVQEELLHGIEQGQGSGGGDGLLLQARVFLELPGRFLVCLLYGFYLSFRLIQMRLRLRRPLAEVRRRGFDLVAKSWIVGAALTAGEDFYYGDLQKRLEERGVRMLLLCGNARDEDWKIFTLENASAGPLCRLPEGCLVPLSAPVALPFLQACASLRLLRSARKFSSPLSRRVALLAARDCLNRKNMSQSLYYEMSRNVVRLWKPKSFLTLYEGYGWEQCLWSGVKKEDPSCRTIGFQHTILFKHSLELLHPLMERLADARPDLVLCSGPGTSTLLKASHTRSEIILFGTFRSAPAAQEARRPDPAKRTVLVLPEGYSWECRTLFNSAMQAARLLPDVRFVFRCHPILPFEQIRSLLDQNPDRIPNVELSRRPSISEDFAAASAVLYRGSSSVLYAILYGLKPIYLHPDQHREIDPLFELTVWKERARSSEELAEILRRYQAAGPDAAEKHWSEALDYVRGYVRPVDESSMDRFLSAIGQEERKS